MKLKALSLAAIIIAASAAAQEQPKTGWSINPFPDVSYNSDIGLNLGGFCDFYYYGDGKIYPNYLHRINIAAAGATKGSWYIHSMFDSKALIPGLKTNGSITYRESKMNNFYGFNGFYSYYDKDLDLNDGKAFYTDFRRLFRATVNVQGPIDDALNWLLGASWRTIGYDNFTHENYDNVNTLYNRYLAADLIGQDEAKGGSNAELRAGFTYDTRDIQAVPNKGIYAELYMLGNLDASHGKYSYAKVVADFRHFIPLVFSKLTFAYHIGLQLKAAGQVPFYMLSDISTLYNLYEESEGLGSRYTARGYLYNRLLGDGYGWGNFELRAELVHFNLFRQYIQIIANPFFDSALIVQHHNLDKQKIFSDKYLFSGRTDNLHNSAGCGLKLHANTNFILSVELAKPFDSQDGDMTVALSTSYTF